MCTGIRARKNIKSQRSINTAWPNTTFRNLASMRLRTMHHIPPRFSYCRTAEHRWIKIVISLTAPTTPSWVLSVNHSRCGLRDQSIRIRDMALDENGSSCRNRCRDGASTSGALDIMPWYHRNHQEYSRYGERGRTDAGSPL
jgi:hypothetical protein